jgi:hypothetical protein
MFETDAQRAIAMHSKRAKQFEGVGGDRLNRQYYDGLVKSIALEIANARKQIWSIKDTGNWPRGKIEAANRAADAQFAEFLDLFKENKTLPAHIEASWESQVVSACVSLARLKLQQQVWLALSPCRSCLVVIFCLLLRMKGLCC